MLSAEHNQLVTGIEKDTPCGNLMRHYWHPAALTEELTAKHAAKAKIGNSSIILKNGGNKIAFT